MSLPGMLLVPSSLNPSIICLQLLCDYLRTESGQPWLSGTELGRILLTDTLNQLKAAELSSNSFCCTSSQALRAETQRRAPGSHFIQSGAG